MEIEEYTLDFYVVQCTDDDGKRISAAKLFADIDADKSSKVRAIKQTAFEMRNLHAKQNFFAGVIAKFRTRNLPHAGKPNGRERELDLEKEEGLLEKTHFLFHKQRNVLLLQRNRLAAGPGRFGEYFTDLTGYTTVCHPILQPEPMKRLISHGSEIKEIDLSVARPSGAILQTPDGKPRWDHNVLEMMASTGAYKIRTIIKANGRSRRKDNVLTRDVLAPLGRLMSRADVTRARVKYDSDADDPGVVDLLADRISATVNVESEGRYPSSDAMWTAAARAWRDHRDEVLSVIGRNDPSSD